MRLIDFQRVDEEFDKFFHATLKSTGSFVAALLLYVAVRFMIDSTSRVHWTLGALTAAAVIVLIIYSLVRFHGRPMQDRSASDALGFFLTIILLGIAVCSWWSLTIHELGAGKYQLPQRYSAGTFADLYAWELIDLIPGLGVWKTLGIVAPVQPTGLATGLPVVAFRALALFGVFAAFHRWRDARNKGKNRERAAVQRAS